MTASRARTMQAAWYERMGPAREVLTVGELPMPEPGHGEVLVKVEASGVNPHDTKRRSGWLGPAMYAPRVIPHSDGAGIVAAVGPGVRRLDAFGTGGPRRRENLAPVRSRRTRRLPLALAQFLERRLVGVADAGTTG